jgi:hypothetical protein
MRATLRNQRDFKHDHSRTIFNQRFSLELLQHHDNSSSGNDISSNNDHRKPEWGLALTIFAGLLPSGVIIMNNNNNSNNNWNKITFAFGNCKGISSCYSVNNYCEINKHESTC